MLSEGCAAFLSPREDSGSIHGHPAPLTCARAGSATRRTAIASPRLYSPRSNLGIRSAVMLLGTALLQTVVVGTSPPLAAEGSEPTALTTSEPGLVYEACATAVVGIACALEQSDSKQQHEYFGTGTVIDPSGFVLTSTTVVPVQASRIRVYMRGGRILAARLIAFDAEREFALLKIDRLSENSPVNFRFVHLGNSAGMRVGNNVYALGNAFQSIQKDDQVAMSAGVVSGRFSLKEARAEASYVGPIVETNAPVNNGMDGGPLLDGPGRRIGMLSLNYSANRWLGTAVPVGVLRRLLERHLPNSDSDDGDKHRYVAYVGVELEETSGPRLRIVSVNPDGPASLAHLPSGALLLRADGVSVRSLDDFQTLFARKQPGDLIRLETLLNENRRTIEFRLWGKY